MQYFHKIKQRARQFLPAVQAELFARLETFLDSHFSAQEKQQDVFQETHILVEYPIDQETLIASMLLPLLRQKNIPLVAIETEFGKEVFRILKTLQKLDHLTQIAIQTPQNTSDVLRKMFLALANDVRVVFIQLAKQLAVLRTLQPHAAVAKQYAEEVLALYAPIAARLGIYRFKNELEEKAFRALFPEEYRMLQSQLREVKNKADSILEQGKELLQQRLLALKVSGDIQARVKDLYSIFQKKKQKEIQSIRDITDLFAFRIIVPQIEDCYSVLGQIHQYWEVFPERFKDYISQPKENGYQSLHTTIIDFLPHASFRSYPVEIQIRNQEMHHNAEFGSAVHWNYKESGDTAKKLKIHWFAEMAQATKNLHGEERFSLFARSFLGESIFVLTEGGDIKILPIGATPIDFAFAVHTDIGTHCQGALVNGKIVSLNTTLQNGDVVKILVNQNVYPKESWLKIAVAPRTRQKIRAFLRSKDKDFFIRKGRMLLNTSLENAGGPPLDTTLSFLKNFGNEGKELSLKEREHILHRIGIGDFSAHTIVKELLEMPDKQDEILLRQPYSTVTATPEAGSIAIAGEKGFRFRLAKCCNPQKGRRILAFITRGGSFTIHDADCKTLARLHNERVMPAHWIANLRQ